MNRETVQKERTMDGLLQLIRHVEHLKLQGTEATRGNSEQQLLSDVNLRPMEANWFAKMVVVRFVLVRSNTKHQSNSYIIVKELKANPPHN